MHCSRHVSFPLQFAFVLLLSCCWAAGGAGAQSLEYLGHQSWTTEDGLPQDSVHAVAQTRDGYLWVATEAGLARYDGVQFQVFDRRRDPAFTSDDLCCLAADGADGLWIGSDDGLIHLAQGKFRHFGKADGLPGSEIRQLARLADGALLLTTAAGPWRWREDGRTAERQAADTPGMGSDGGWSWTAQTVTRTSGGTRRAWQAGRELPQGRIAAFAYDREGRGWIGMNTGLFVVDASSGAVSRVAALADSSVLSIFQDAEGSHWIGTESSGLHVLRSLRFRGLAGLAGKAITSVTQTGDGVTWVGTRDDGLYRLRGEMVDQPVAVRALTSAVILCLQPSPDGGLWVGTPDGLNYVSRTNTVRHIGSADGLPDDYIRSLLVAADGSLWVGTQHGLAHLLRQGRETITVAGGLGGELIGSLLLVNEPVETAASAGLWVATSGGLSHIGKDRVVTNMTTSNGLPSAIVRALAADSSGRVWVATDDGTIARVDGARFVPVFRFGQEGGPGARVQAMVADSAGGFWMRMDRGILRIGSPQVQDCLAHGPCRLPDERVARFGPADGIRNDEAVPRAIALPWSSPTGAVWFPTRSGVAIASPATALRGAAEVPVVLERVLLDDESLDTGSGMMQLPFGHQRLTLEYAGLSFVAPLEIQYRYRLAGFDMDWKAVGNRRSATYTNLAPGSYTFLVEARTNETAWSSHGATISVRIIPPVYRRWWFLVLLVVVALLLLAALYLLRLRRLRLQFDAVLAERNRMAREIHDTLTQDFVSTSLQLDIIAQQLKRGHIDKALEQVRRARLLVTDGLAEARQSIWELRAESTQHTLPTRMANLVQRESFAAIHPQLQVRGAYRALASQVERELLKLAQEALTNVKHHAGSHHASLDLYYSSEALMLRIEDDGVGFDLDTAGAKQGHYGLMGMQERASTIGGTLEIVSEPGRGTRVTVRVPLAQEAR